MNKLVALVVIAFVFGMLAFTGGTKVTVNCGPQVSTPLVMQGIDGAGSVGDKLHEWSESKPSAIKVTLGAWHTVGMLIRVFKARLNGNPIPADAVAVREEGIRLQRAALTSCCVTPNPSDPAPNAPSPPQGPGFDPKSAALMTALTGAPLAEDALRRARFPEGEIPMGREVARLETGFRNILGPIVRGSQMKGMWQINWNVHPEVHSFGDWRDPYVNARMAYSIWAAAGRSWSPWSTASAAARRLGTTPTPPSVAPQAPLAALPAYCPSTPAAPGAAGSLGGGPVPAEFNQQGNPRTVEAAIGWYRAHLPDGKGVPVVGMCERWLTLAYGWPGGYATALAHWNAPGPRSVGMATLPPRGSLVYWRTGNPAGHTAISLGNGQVISTDYNAATHRYQAGMVSAGPIEDIDRWAGGVRLGWRAPSFRIIT